MLLRQKIRTPIWPYIAVVSCLFLLSVLASQSWRSQHQREETTRRAVAVMPGLAPSKPTAVRTPPPTVNVWDVAATGESLATAATPTVTIEPTVTPILTIEPSATPIVPIEPSAAPIVPVEPSAPQYVSMEKPVSRVASAEPPVSRVEPVGKVAAAESHVAESTYPIALHGPASFEHGGPVPGQAPDQPEPVEQSVPAAGERIKLDISVKKTPALPTESAATREPAAEAPSDRPRMPLEPAPRGARERSAIPAVPKVDAIFPRPELLVSTLESLKGQPSCQAWVQQTLRTLDALHRSPSLTSPQAVSLVEQLQRDYQRAYQLASRTNDLPLRATILRTGYALQRRAEIWRQVQRIAASGQDRLLPTTYAGMTKPLMAVEQRLASGSHGREWRQYLLLDDVQRLLHGGDAAARRELAHRVLKRIDSQDLTDGQRGVFRNPPFDEFNREMRRWASGPVDYLQLLGDLEQYERTLSHANGLAVARYHELLGGATAKEVVQLNQLLNMYYRNSNLRVALSEVFLNRLLPAPQQLHENIEDQISGAYVQGTSQVVNHIRARLVPDGDSWRIGLELEGEVLSDTAASKGPATFYNQGVARFHARKMLLIDRLGVRVWRAEAAADSETELRGFETAFDTLPIINWFARSVARQQHDDKYPQAKAETEAKIEHRASSRFDDEVERRLAEAESQVNERLLRPFEKIDLKPTPVDLRTTEQRIIARFRLASDVQLGAHTPRPQAPADSLISIQMHESAMNNLLASLKLEGRRTDLATLFRDIASTLERSDLPVPDDLPDDVIVQFADQDAVRIRCEDDRVALTIRIAELRGGRNLRWTNFAVRAYYVPDAKQLAANLVRDPDGVIELSGERLGDRLPLRGIFNKVLARNRAVNMINKKIAENPNLSDSHVNQFVISDGWIGIAIGPHYGGELRHLAKERNATSR